MGLRVDNASFDYAAMSDRKDQVVSKLRNGVKQLLKANGVTVFQGTRVIPKPPSNSGGAVRFLALSR